MKMITLASSLAGENSNKPRRLNVALDMLIEYLLKATKVDDIAGDSDSARKTMDLDQCNEAQTKATSVTA